VTKEQLELLARFASNARMWPLFTGEARALAGLLREHAALLEVVAECDKLLWGDSPIGAAIDRFRKLEAGQ
jgi:hypothetical protein